MQNKSLTVFLLASLCLTASSLAAQTIVDENWADGNRDIQNPPNSIQWFSSILGDPDDPDNPTAFDKLPVPAGGGSMQLLSDSTTTYAIGYFDSVTLQANQTLKFSYDFSLQTISSSGTPWFRIGLFNSATGGGRIDADGLGATNDVYKGYRGYLINENNARTGQPRLYRRKSSKSSGNLMTSTGDTIYTRQTETIDRSEDWNGYIAGASYTGVFVITHNDDDSVTLAQSLYDANGTFMYTISATDTASPEYYTYDTIAFALTKTLESMTLTNVKIELGTVPEPSTVAAILALAAAGTLLIRRKRARRSL